MYEGPHNVGGIKIPREINDRIGYENWQKLSHALHHGWVQEGKLWMSQKAGHDVGVPQAVWNLVGPRRDDGWTGHNIKVSPDERTEDVRRLMIIGYLLGTDYVSPLWVRVDGKWEQTGIIPDEDGANQLEGELRRYSARKRGIKPGDVELGEWVVQMYCCEHGLDGEVVKFCKNLGL